uniref:Uncharacterized protein n=1 Tax=Cucumis melo TaxID=3656 RepID=A0A9I9EBW6_CUCME
MDIVKLSKTKIKNEQSFIGIFDPKASGCSIEGIDRKERILRPYFIDVFEDDDGLTHGFCTMNKHRNLLVKRIVVKQRWTFVRDIFFNVFIWYALKLQTPFHSANKRTCPHPMEFHFFHR